MKTKKMVRLSNALLESLQREAAMRRVSVTAIVLEAMALHLEGRLHLEKQEKVDRQMSFLCHTRDLDAFKELAAEANMSLDEALRQILLKREQ